MNTLPARRLPQYAIEQTTRHASRIRTHARLRSPVLTTACVQAGLPIELAEICGGLLASVVDDLVAVSRMSKADFNRSKRMERILDATEEPAVFGLKLAMAASPVNGRACARHWDAICEKGERGKLAWLLGMDTDTAWRYGQKIFKRNAK